MTKDDVIRMAREAGCDVQEGYVAYCDIDDLCELVRLAAATEREACAEVIDGNIAASTPGSRLHDILTSNAAAIRARGEENAVPSQTLATSTWCNHCGEGVTTFCRGGSSSSACPMGMQKPGGHSAIRARTTP